MTLTIHRHRYTMSRPDGLEVYDQVAWTFAPRPEASETTSSATGIVHRRSASKPVEVTAPVSMLERGSLTTLWDPVGWPAEMVARAAAGGRHGFAMVAKPSVSPGPWFDELVEASPPAEETRGPEGPFERGMAAIAVVHAQEDAELEQVKPAVTHIGLDELLADDQGVLNRYTGVETLPEELEPVDLQARFYDRADAQALAEADRREAREAPVPISVEPVPVASYDALPPIAGGAPSVGLVEGVELLVAGARRAMALIGLRKFANAEAHLRTALEAWDRAGVPVRREGGA